MSTCPSDTGSCLTESSYSARKFETAQNPDQDYIGIWAREPFDRLEIRETTTANENEFFGTVSISQMPLPTTIFNDRFESVP